MECIDLRSDTITRPTPAMREAMAKAPVGDDVYGEDPTVNRLQEMAAERMGKEAGLFVASGTMGNLTAILSHCQRGDEVIVGNKAHTFLFEAGGISVLGGVHSCQLPNQPDGSLALENIRAAIRPDDPHEPISRLICLENTHNRCGGTCQSAAYISEVASFAHERGLKVHLDGARIFNAADRAGCPGQSPGGPGRFGHVLSEQSAVRAGRILAVRNKGIYCQSQAHPQNGRRRDAPGRHPGSGRYRGA